MRKILRDRLHVRLPRHHIMWLRARAKRDGNTPSEQLAEIVQAALREHWRKISSPESEGPRDAP